MIGAYLADVKRGESAPDCVISTHRNGGFKFVLSGSESRLSLDEEESIAQIVRRPALEDGSGSNGSSGGSGTRISSQYSAGKYKEKLGEAVSTGRVGGSLLLLQRAGNAGLRAAVLCRRLHTFGSR
jgi:hypothetical protein